ncbi:AAA domain-containing protein [Ditylenchus destructor]|uniref:AAA domain-containing protein n=1 Tax=Ditylenchus destructor TaxID=166010 RepID=A0AAD4N452_9BILA|nr:AAA domain-containing protein [Ditylenchus destructor]
MRIGPTDTMFPRKKEEPQPKSDAKRKPSRPGRTSGPRGRSNSHNVPAPAHGNEANKPGSSQKMPQRNLSNNARSSQYNKGAPPTNASKNVPKFSSLRLNAAGAKNKGKEEAVAKGGQNGQKNNRVFLIGSEKLEQICSDLDCGKMLEGSSDLLKEVQTRDFMNRLDAITHWKDMTSRIDRLLGKVDAAVTNLKRVGTQFLNERTMEALNNLEEAIQARLTEKASQIDLQDKENVTNQVEKYQTRIFVGSRGLPPQNFRNLSVIPVREDFEEGDKTVYLRPNKIHGNYDDGEHYLDVHFRLLREDLIRPLRDGIQEYRQQMRARQRSAQFKPSKKPDLYVYRDVQVFEGELYQQTGQLLNYVKLQTHRNMHWNKKLIYGSLVCLSSDDFNKNFIFGLVQDRDEKMLWKGKVGLKLENPGQLKTTVLYNMVESPAFFEAYKHVMLAMQSIRMNGAIPFARYLVHAETNTNRPEYIEKNNGRINFDIVLQKDEPIKNARSLSNNITELGESIKAEDWGMDQSQFEALKYALSNELVVMQGPPGTGKTYLGLQLTRILLANQRIWTAQGDEAALADDIDDDGFYIPPPRSDDRPILVVCYTNHALDQFLEGISQSLKNGIIRIGGQCKNAALKRFMLHNVRHVFNEARRRAPRDNAASSVRYDLYETKDTVKSLQQKMEKLMGSIIQLESRLPSPNALEGIFTDRNLPYCKSVKYFLLETKHFMFHWLTRSGKPEMDLQILLELREWGFPEITIKNAAYHMFSLGIHSCHEIAEWILSNQERGTPISDTYLIPEIRHWPKFADIKRVTKECHVHQFVATQMLSSMDNPVVGNVLNAHRRHRNVQTGQNFKARNLNAINEGEIDAEFLLAARDETADNRMLYAPVDEIFTVQSKQKKKKKEWFVPELMKLYEPLIKTAPAMSEDEAQNVGADIWKLSLQDRWRLYQYWINKELPRMTMKLKDVEADYGHNVQRFLELRSLADVEVLRTAKVIGMTTTGAAKHQAALLSLKPRIVIVEEAAEVLEAHLLACLTLACEHFILIGDHQQLRPNPAVYELAKDYKLDVSLFERLINNGYPYRALKRQHRMRPEISRVLMPHFYPDLEDDNSVMDLPHVLGVTKDLLFINHSHPEENRSQILSHSNLFEADYSVRLAFYFIQQGYKADQVTILCTYLDQLLEVRKRANNVFGKDHKIRIENVDNYQGEECDIIILSLVRSNNPDNKIGYLNISNRVCVALSRAKIGLYVLGNMDFLASRCKLWMQIRKSVEDAGAMSEGTFPVKCQMHGVEQVIESLEEFDKKCPEGGCGQPCNFRRDCGHTCMKMCHATDSQHKDPCIRPCEKRCNSEFQHPCKKQCSKPCGDCKEEVVKHLPCGHSKLAGCALPTDKILCNEKCTRLLSCTHPVKMKCSDNVNTFKCTANVLKRWPICGHEVETKCSTDVNLTLCPKPCATPLAECGHLCLGTCGKCRNGRIHVACKENCKRILVCGHECKSKCSKICPPCDRPCETICGHSQCGKMAVFGEQQKKTRLGYMDEKPCPKCVEECHNQCEHRKCDSKCWMPCKVPPCQEPCNNNLPCPLKVKDGKRTEDPHKCIGVCGEECLSICKICDPKKFEEIQTIFFGTEEDDDARFVRLKDCGHIFEVTGLDHWVESKSTSTAVSIVPIECPKCKTPIKRSSRYISALNKRAFDIEQIKRFNRGKSNRDLMMDFAKFDTKKLQPLMKEVQDVIDSYGEHRDIYRDFQIVFGQLRSVKDNNLTVHWINTARNVLRIADQIWKMFQSIRKENFSFSFDPLSQEMSNAISVLQRYNIVALPVNQFLYAEIDYLLKRLAYDNDMRNIAELTLVQIAHEMDRLSLLKDLMTYLGKVFNTKTDFNTENNKRFHTLLDGLYGNKEFTGEHRDALKQQFKELTERHKVPNFGISEAERIEIVKALGYDVRNWYKCSKGHLYGIGDCGMAMVSSKCPECNEEIGGSQHRLVSTSRDTTNEFRRGVAPLLPIIPPEFNQFLNMREFLPL